MRQTVLHPLIDVSKDGEWGKAEPFPDSVAMRVIRGTDFESVRQGDLSPIPVRYISRRIAERKTLRARDLLIETAGGSKGRPTGRTLYLNGRTFDRSDLPVTCASFSRFIRLKPDCGVDPRYLFWHLQWLYLSRRMLQYHTQHTGVARFQWTTFSTHELLDLPSPLTQQTTAAILSTYDDLIENNLRRTRIFEEMAQALYREWFVEFRFPGHGEARMVDSPMGKIPEGWKPHRLGEVLELAYGKGLKKSDRAGGPVPVFGSSGVVGHHDTHLVKGPGIIVGRKGNVGSVHWSREDFYPIDTVFYVKTSLPLQYVFYNLQTQNFINSDAAVPGLSRDQAYSLPFLVPSNTLLEDFEDKAATFWELANNLSAKNAVLRQTRDLLLPRLISGELDVTDIDVGEEAA